MSNNKQQTAVEWQFEQLFNSFEKFNNDEYTFDEYLKRNLEIREQAKEMYQEEIEEKLNVAYGNGYEQGEMDFYKKMQGKGDQYADGYAEGYKRALEMVEWYIKNYISGMVQEHIGDINKMVGGGNNG